VLLVGCGALGCVVAEQLVRAGVGHLVLVDRDVVETTNLQRQVLFDEADAKAGIPKAIAAFNRLSSINSTIKITPVVSDVHAGNIESLTGVDLIVDGTDNAETRYLLNDVSVKRNIPWVYGACVGTDGRVMAIQPGVTPCLQCVFPEPPGVGELQTCDTAGVLGPAISVVAGYQAVEALKLLTGHTEAILAGLLTIDFWKNRHRSIFDFSIGRWNPRLPRCAAETRCRFDRAGQLQSTSNNWRRGCRPWARLKFRRIFCGRI
jgi:molybdopterin/thiamine biosynthesis adenylyltransferase